MTGSAPPPTSAVGLGTVLRAWGRIGCLGFGGPPVHVAMLRERCVEREGWIDADEFEDAIAFTNLLPGPASSQLAILTAWRVGGRLGGLVGGLAFVLPGLVLMIALAALFLAGAPPAAVRGAGAGAGAVVAAVAVHAGWSLLGPSLARARAGRTARWVTYVVLGAVASALAGPWVVLVLVGCGLLELVLRPRPRSSRGGAVRGPLRLHAWPVALPVLAAVGGIGPLAWTAFKVGALSYGGGFVIVPLMRADAVERHGWLTDARFLDVVALGQVTPGPVVHTVSGVGYAAHGVGGAVLAAVVAFAPSFALILALAPRFGTLRHDERLRAFLDGAGPAAIGAILGAAVPLALAIGEAWQVALLVAGAVALLTGRAGVLTVLLGAGLLGALAGALGVPLPA
ncbi:chromate efflux transporter [Patulibacter sp.]|uniref:chromate efflux transporter n=1 Tax=Patulibacter sp. TaxID=1912859 RepID=UPI00271AA3A1|nr:chromate efflux transporter [Patulibacter sp.]MDO9407516.1 chromate efflux transporter [Patulibacter sp.]